MLGLDFSEGLLSVARQGLPENFTFLQADLSSPGWDEALQRRTFSFVLAFAVLHHLPGQALRRRLLSTVRARLPGGGRLIHSEWQFLHSPRLRARLQPWETIGLAADQVDEGDYLLDWRAGGSGLRYAHHFSEAELAEPGARQRFPRARNLLFRRGRRQAGPLPGMGKSINLPASTYIIVSFKKPLRRMEYVEV